ncbi:MAG: hypothetical protein MUC94_14770 [bacterium]|jgi:hypothetical protein|nr:hypothetical protein [bacterium]
MKSSQTIADSIDKIETTISGLIAFLESNDFKGWEPYELPELSWLQSHRLRTMTTQLLRLFPIALHGYFNEKKLHPKAAALFARAFLNLHEITSEQKYYEKALFFLEWLIAHRSAQSKHFSIGNLHQLSMKTYQASPDTPSPLITCFAVEAFISAYEASQDEKFFEAAESGIKFFLEELPLRKVSATECFFVYHSNNEQFIPNAPAAISGTLSRFYGISKEPSLLRIIKNNFNYIAKSQNSDGSWLYHPDSRYVDNFHTAFILEALAKFQYYTSDNSFETVLSKGLAFYLKTFFTSTWKPIHKKRSGFPSNADSLLTKIDLRDIAMGLSLFSTLHSTQRNQLSLALKLLDWSIEKFKSREGYFYYQQVPLYTIKGPFLRMQAWMLYGLSQILKVMKSLETSSKEGNQVYDQIETKFIESA